MRSAVFFCYAALFALQSKAIETPVSRRQVDVMAQTLESALFNISVNNPPYYDSNQKIESTCWQNRFECSESNFFNRNFMRKVDKASIRLIKHVDAMIINDGVEMSEIESIKTTAKLFGTTTGWQIQGRVGLASKGNATADVTGSYNSATQESTTITEMTRYFAKCPGGQICKLTTITFQATLEGQCEEVPHLQCGDSLASACTQDEENNRFYYKCNQYADYLIQAEMRQCLHKTYPNAKPYVGPCKVEFPVMDENGDIHRPVEITAEATTTRMNFDEA
ncbi:hypothetical protein QQS21_004201 [Conoideocrella luteorostrata]|uniref:Uncharacterized protein n=1 Tax=Conoideocrella luteorostrata TaxID=1105319 RepID=A0AAJ0CUU7_9HYPO|nr:hypothetical protein QQS21_004201 [Conoideocrella luteorostrata]